MEYTMWKADGVDKGGMLKMPADVLELAPAHWSAYIAVDDVDGAASKATELGGMVMVLPQNIPGVGRFTVIQDPTGALVGLVTFPK